MRKILFNMVGEIEIDDNSFDPRMTDKDRVIFDVVRGNDKLIVHHVIPIEQKKLRIEGKQYGKIDCKRFYLEGVTVYSHCPKCNQEKVLDFSQNYLSYPVANQPQKLYFYCEPCNYDWKEEVFLEVSLKPSILI